MPEAGLSITGMWEVLLGCSVVQWASGHPQTGEWLGVLDPEGHHRTVKLKPSWVLRENVMARPLIPCSAGSCNSVRRRWDRCVHEA